jgi:2-oxoisovalerate dehydrogenase E1 component
MQASHMEQTLIDLYKSMVMSRESDIIEAELVNSGEANFLASSKGHEGSTILAPFLQKSDYLHCHYRDKALMLARGITSEMFFYSALAKAESHSHGRQMVSHMNAPELNILSMVGPVGNNALQAAGIADTIKAYSDNPIVICCMGDGTSQQGEVLEAIAEAKRSCLPILFFIHNNDLAISTRTAGKTFFSLPNGKQADSFYDTPINYIDGINPFAEYEKIQSIITTMRSKREPQILILNVDRLDNHSNADNQKLYRGDAELIKSLQNDPITHSYEFLVQKGLDRDQLDKIRLNAITVVRKAIDIARQGTNPQATFDAEKPLPAELKLAAPEYRGDFNVSKRLTMLESMRETFKHHLSQDKNVYLLGQDIEDGKGDVFGITKGLSTAFPNQVKNSALSESTIAGMSVGMALAGRRPVAFIQFADFMPLAYNQIFSELATMYWRTNGGWQCPVIIFAACGAYRPGLGPFHSQTNEATYAHIPGIDVYMPSNAADAAGLLNAAFKSSRPSIFLYPKKLLNNSSLQDTTSPDIQKHVVPVGKARIAKSGSDITLVGWGNTVALCHQVSETLESIGIDAEIIDLRTIKPYDIETILTSAQKTQNLIVTHEDNQTCGMGSEIIAATIEKSTVNIKVRRVVKSDTYTPCNYTNQIEVLPSYEKILTAAAELLDLSLTWKSEELTDKSAYTIEVIGASPSDESVIINKIQVKVGDKVKSGDTIVEIEASKSAGEIVSPCNGYVEAIYVTETESAHVGSPLLKIRLDADANNINAMSAAKPKHAILSRKAGDKRTATIEQKNINSGAFPVGMTTPTFKTGSRQVANAEILKKFPEYTTDDIIKRTGIENRYWLSPNESILDIAVQSVTAALDANKLKLSDINLIICATCSPEQYQSPSLACLILERLYHIYGEHAIPAYDLNAACSGYIYAMQSAKDYLQTRPSERVLLITAESLSNRINHNDFDTAFLFGDAATTTILLGNNYINQSKLVLGNIHLSSVAENGDVLNIPINQTNGITLQGKRLFTFAVKTMASVMNKCCQKENTDLASMDLVIPHQANQRIIAAVERQLNLPAGLLHSNIANYGNTSSSTIPIALAETLPNVKKGQHVALCAFGAGFTSGAALLTAQ